MLGNVIALGVALASSILAADIGNVAVCYSPDHLEAYSVNNGGEINQMELQRAMDNDFKMLSQHFTHVRTFSSHYSGASPAKAAAATGVKLYLGIPMTTHRSHVDAQVSAAIQAVKDYPGTVDVILVGDKNLWEESDVRRMLEVVSAIKKGLGDLSDTVKFGTSQSIDNYLMLEDHAALLDQGLDVLGVEIMPYRGRRNDIHVYDPVNPLVHVKREWDQMKTKFSLPKMRLTKTGFPTEPSLNDSITYYKALKGWKPDGATSVLKFWCMAFDRRPDTTSALTIGEPRGGFFTHDGNAKVLDGGFPVKISDPEPEPSVYAYAFEQCASRIVALRADTGRYITRCEAWYCSPGSTRDWITVHTLTPKSNRRAQWRVRRLQNGKFAFQADTGLYMGRCHHCYNKQDSVVVNVQFPEDIRAAQWDVLKLTNGKFAFRADTGNLMARCNDCLPAGEGERYCILAALTRASILDIRKQLLYR
ncbi:TPA: hypothetical protein N0F65_012167 [Lagenidium giganteum]|uniref:glucan endo-1,3-beta-D-glucosidase n=1 Tax=Lagenidium giganteum TaxID=4803 RepID=A0AAV2YZG0_9STRA|nr:TPA: hypothetical protein N0F65_012167 [Lagenidium giganteum]